MAGRVRRTRRTYAISNCRSGANSRPAATEPRSPPTGVPAFRGRVDAPGIGRDPESGAIVLYALLPFATTTPADFAEAVPQFLDRAHGLADRLASFEARE